MLVSKKDDVKALVRAAANVFPDEASGESAGTVDEVEDACAKIVKVILATLGAPGDELRGYIQIAAARHRLSDDVDPEAMFVDIIDQLRDRFAAKTVIKPL